MKRFGWLMGLWLVMVQVIAQDTPYAELRIRAEKAFAEGSYAQARELYEKAAGLELSATDKRWVEFRLADTLWRDEAGTRVRDRSNLDKARHRLEMLIKDRDRPEEQDLVWVESQESLGDLHWSPNLGMNWGATWGYFNRALEWWARSPDIEQARARYLRIVWKAASPPARMPRYYYGYHGNYIPIQVLENVLKIATAEEDKARVHFLLAMTLRQSGGDQSIVRTPVEFEEAIKFGKKTDWLDDALYGYGEHLINSGEVVPLPEGGYTTKRNYRKAVTLFRRLLAEYDQGESPHYLRAQEQIQTITRQSVNLLVDGIFLPGSEVQFRGTARNVSTVELGLFKMNLTAELRLKGENSAGLWLRDLETALLEKVKSWKVETKDEGDHEERNFLERLGKLETGAYLLEASGGGDRSRSLLLVSDVSLIVKSVGNESLVYVCDAVSGAPIPEASVRFFQRRWLGQDRWRWEQRAAQADKDGLARFAVENQAPEIIVTARKGDRQTFAFAHGSYRHEEEAREQWKIYAFTDKPAYRPGDTVHWKITARIGGQEGYRTPAGKKIRVVIGNENGDELTNQLVTLNSFGSAWGDLAVTEEMMLGMYEIGIGDEKGEEEFGSSPLFRLEEYKLPEFKVALSTPKENGKPKVFLVGDQVEVEIDAQYYFGGPVANATVEVVVNQHPFYSVIPVERDFPWLYQPNDAERHFAHRGEQVILRETIRTDGAGKAKLVIPTSAREQQDLELQIEARVTDASRREVTGSGSVRVTRQPYQVRVTPAHHIYRPQDKVEAEFKAQDANGNPVAAEGTVKITREYWFEIWVDPTGREVKGEELKRFQQSELIFPPPPVRKDDKPWKLKFRGYERDEISTQVIRTGTNGIGSLSFKADREGYYRIAWTSKDMPTDRLIPVVPTRAEATVWVATTRSTELGYRSGGVEIILDKETFRAGQKVPVMLSVPSNNKYVLFTSEGKGLLDARLVHIEGTVKLIELEIAEKHIPNFRLDAVMVSDQQAFTASEEVIVPPVKNFLEVTVSSPKEEFLPRSEGNFEITVKDHEGKPVETEVAVSAIDESLFYIQGELAGDPRQFFFGEKRYFSGRLDSTFNAMRFLRMVEEEDQLIEEQELVRERRKVMVAKGRHENLITLSGATDLPAARTVSLGMELESRSAAPMQKDALAENLMFIADTAAAPQAPALMAAEAPGQPQVQVRSDFRNALLWVPDIKTGRDGRATVPVKYSESLTGWKTTARAVSKNNQFGIGSTLTRTKQPLIVRLQAPRFFVVGDETTVTANIINNTPDELTASVSLELEGLPLPEFSKRSGIRVPANGEQTLNWKLSVMKAGAAKIKVIANAGELGDAVERGYPIHEHGINKFISASAKQKEKEGTLILQIPGERKKESTLLTVQVTPSLAVTMLDALPYLIDYPYGCTEQTMSRFLPAAITAKTLKDAGLDPAEAMSRVFGGIELAHTNKTQPKGKKDLNQLEAMVAQGIQRLSEMQHEVGSWGWWKSNPSDGFMTAYVVWGYALAKSAGFKIDEGGLNAGVDWLRKHLVEAEGTPDLQSWMLHALAAAHQVSGQPAIDKFETVALDKAYQQRDRLNAYSRSLLALAAHQFGKADQARVLVRNLANGVKRDNPAASRIVAGSGAALQTAHWGEDGIFHRWSEGGVEATSFVLRALLAIDPKNELIEPTVNWLVMNRRGAQWSNTRDTAITLLALNEYLKSSGELQADVEFEVLVNEQSAGSRKIAGKDVFNAPTTFKIDLAQIRDGQNSIKVVRKSGDAPLYVSASVEFFSLEEPIPAAGNQIFATREYYRIKPIPTLLSGFVYEREKLNSGDRVTSGERIEVVVTMEAKNNFEYLVFEDLKPAGLEAVAVQSGEMLMAVQLRSDAIDRKQTRSERAPKAGQGDPDAPNAADQTGLWRSVHQELRDRKVACFLDKMDQGVWEIRYELRAEVPGEFHALPLLGHAMYVPEIRCNSAETKIQIEDRP